MARKNVLSQFASLSEDALGKLAQNPTAGRILQSAMELRERVDDLTRRVRGLEGLEQRIDALEKRMEGMQAGGQPAGSAPEPPAPAATAATTTKSSGA